MKFKKILVEIWIVFLFSNIYAGEGDTTIIPLHNKVDMECWKGVWYYPEYDVWYNYQFGSKPIKKVYLDLRLGCASFGCCGWDYGFSIYLMKKTGLTDSSFVRNDTNKTTTPYTITKIYTYFEKLEQYGIGRLITPYAPYMQQQTNGFNRQWQHPYLYDITDYLPLLKDSTSIRVSTGGWDNTGKYGFNATTKLIVIEGSPNQTVSDIIKLQGGKNFQDSIQFDTSTPAKTISIPANVASAKLRLKITGHGQGGEFDPHSFYLKVNGQAVFKEFLYTKCGENPLQPQGGTWVYNRCGWCPGGIVYPYEIDVTSYLKPGKDNTFDISFEDFQRYTPPSGSPYEYNYDIDMKLITYSMRKKKDVAISQIVAPNSDIRFGKVYNKLSTKPIITIKNEGIETATNVWIDYWLDSNYKFSHEWKGSLRSGASADIEVEMPNWNYTTASDTLFTARLKPLFSNSDYSGNDQMASSFSYPDGISDTVIVVNLTTNKKPEQNWYLFKNEFGDTVVIKSNLEASKVYKDTVRLTPGCYVFEMWDYVNDLDVGNGLAWWAASSDGNGSISLKKLDGSTIKSFNPDFGTVARHQFSINHSGKPNKLYDVPNNTKAKYVEISSSSIANGSNQTPKLALYPNPIHDKLSIMFDAISRGSKKIEIYSLNGQLIKSYQVESNILFTTINISDIKAGNYLIQIRTDDGIFTQKVQKQD